MPYRTQWEPNGILWTVYGAFTDSDLLSLNADFYADPRSDKTRFQILDTSEVESPELSPAFVRAVGAHDLGASSYFGNVKVAIVATHPLLVELAHAYGELLRKHSATWQAKTFSTLEAARDWIERS